MTVSVHSRWPKKWPYTPLDTYLIAVLKVLRFNIGQERIVISNGMREQLKFRGWAAFTPDEQGFRYRITRLGEREIAMFDTTCAGAHK